MSEQNGGFNEWAIAEFLGHRRLAGLVSEQNVAGAGLLRLDIYTDGPEPVMTQLYAPSALYCITPTTEDVCRRFAAAHMPQPVSRWELPAPAAAGPPDVLDEPYYDPELHRDDDPDEGDDLDDLPL